LPITILPVTSLVSRNKLSTVKLITVEELMMNFSYLDDLDEEMRKSHSRVSEDSETLAMSNESGNGFGDVYSPVESEASETYNPQKLNARHREMIRLHALGYKGVQIANILGVTPQNVYDILNSPLGQSFISEIQEARTSSVQDVQNRLQEFSPLAAELVLDIMNEGVKESNRLKAGLKVLEMTGHKPGDTVNHNHVHLTKEDIEDIKATHKGGPRLEEENTDSKSFNETNHLNETNHQLPEHSEAEIINETSENDAKHIPTNRKDD